MTDLEITRLCAEAMGYTKWGAHFGEMPGFTKETGVYDPLHDDAQAMALLSRFRLAVIWIGIDVGWRALDGKLTGESIDLRRAICLVVAKMQAAK